MCQPSLIFYNPTIGNHKNSKVEFLANHQCPRSRPLRSQLLPFTSHSSFVPARANLMSKKKWSAPCTPRSMLWPSHFAPCWQTHAESSSHHVGKLMQNLVSFSVGTITGRYSTYTPPLKNSQAWPLLVPSISFFLIRFRRGYLQTIKYRLKYAQQLSSSVTNIKCELKY